MRGTRILIAIAIVVSSAAAMPDARAEAGAVLVTGSAKAPHRAVIATAVTTTLRGAGWSLVDATFTDDESRKVLACLDLDRPWVCVAPTARDKGFARMLVVSVEEAPNRVTITAQLLVAGDGVPPSDQRVCEGTCTEAALGESAGSLTQALLAREAVRSGKTTIAVRTIPEGAVITLDGTMLGQSNKTLDVAPGEHTILLQRSGYEPATRMVRVKEGEAQTVEVTLKAEGDGRHDGDNRSSRWLPIGVIGAGSLALIGGVVLQVAKDGPPLGEQQPARLYSAPGIGLAIGGGLAIGAGIYLLLHGKSDDTAPRSGPTVTITEQTGAIGWTGSF